MNPLRRRWHLRKCERGKHEPTGSWVGGGVRYKNPIKDEGDHFVVFECKWCGHRYERRTVFNERQVLPKTEEGVVSEGAGQERPVDAPG